MSLCKVIVGLSGGVDSSVAACVLQQQGYDVEAMFMQNWSNTCGTLHGSCTWEDDVAIARLTAERLGIPFHFIDLSAQYMERVASYMFAEYERGRTPNPDVLCNSKIKFDAFLNAALERGAEMVATGHYCRKSEIMIDGRPVYNLLAGSDPNKDQSYFLCGLSQRQLRYAMFPIGEMLKPDVRKIAQQQHLPAADRKDSQGICFIGKVDLPVFLQQKLAAKEGSIIEIPKDYTPSITTADNLRTMALQYNFTPQMGKVIGTHKGAHFYTIGQRKGFGIGGHKESLFVLATDIANNIVYVGEGRRHKGLWRKALWIDAAEQHWVRPDMALTAGEARRYSVRIRYRQTLQDAVLHCYEDGLLIVFDDEQCSIAPGQFAAWYDGDCLHGSGVISSM
jgi:tRNA-specific 2-thiouridylase